MAESARTRDRAVRSIELKVPLLRGRGDAEDDDLGGTLVVAAAPWPGGGHVWVTSYVPPPRGERLWRLGAALLALKIC